MIKEELTGPKKYSYRVDISAHVQNIDRMEDNNKMTPLKIK